MTKLLIDLKPDLSPTTKAHAQYMLDKLKKINPPLEIEVLEVVD